MVQAELEALCLHVQKRFRKPYSVSWFILSLFINVSVANLKLNLKKAKRIKKYSKVKSVCLKYLYSCTITWHFCESLFERVSYNAREQVIVISRIRIVLYLKKELYSKFLLFLKEIMDLFDDRFQFLVLLSKVYKLSTERKYSDLLCENAKPNKKTGL